MPLDLATGPLAHRHAVTVAGTAGARPVVFAHGFGTDQTMWRFVADDLAADCLVVLLDHVGAGRSDLSAYDSRRHASLRGYALDVVALLEELALGPVAYVGHSASAIIGVLASIERPDLFSALLLVGGSPRYLDDEGYTGGFTREDVDALLHAMDSNYLAWSRALAPAVMGTGHPDLTQELADSFARTEARIATEFARAIFLSDHRGDLARVSVPTLVVQASQDPMVPEQVGRHLAAAIPGSTLEVLTATGHFPHLSGADETTSVLRRFLDR